MLKQDIQNEYVKNNKCAHTPKNDEIISKKKTTTAAQQNSTKKKQFIDWNEGTANNFVNKIEIRRTKRTPTTITMLLL